MRNIWTVFKTDIKTLSKCFFACAVVVAIAVLPSLYAWLNIYSNWDPYGNTGGISIALASLDKGYTDEDGVYVNKGDDVVNDLREATSINWVVVDSEKQAKDGVYAGDYYAAVVIDKDLDTPAVYDPQRMELAINPDYPDHEMFAAIATAVAHSRLHGKGYNAQYDYAESDLDAQSVSYLLCRRFGVERDLPDTAELPALYDGWDAQERRQALDQIQKMSKQIGASVEKSITPQRSRVPMQHNGR